MSREFFKGLIGCGTRASVCECAWFRFVLRCYFARGGSDLADPGIMAGRMFFLPRGHYSLDKDGERLYIVYQRPWTTEESQ